MSEDAVLARLAGWRVLVVEDEYLVADDLRRELEAAGAHVIGPAPNVRSAQALIADARPDAAILDVNVGGDCVEDLAGELMRRGVPIVLSTGYDAWALPASLADAPRCQKPVGLDALAHALFRRIDA